MSGWRSVVLAMTLVVTGFTAAVPVAAEPDQTTPDRVARAFLEAFAAQDLDAMLALSTADDKAEGLHFTDMVADLGAYTLSMLAPSEYPFYAAMNRETLEGRIVSAAFNLARSLLTDQDVAGGQTIPMSEGQADFFVQDMDPARLAELQVLDSRLPDPDVEHDPETVQWLAKSAAYAGADERTERLVLVSLGDALYEVGIGLLRYGDRWEVDSLMSGFGRTSALGAARPTTQEAYDRHTSGDYSDLDQ